jgi:hypothetical protein
MLGSAWGRRRVLGNKLVVLRSRIPTKFQNGNAVGRPRPDIAMVALNKTKRTVRPEGEGMSQRTVHTLCRLPDPDLPPSISHFYPVHSPHQRRDLLNSYDEFLRQQNVPHFFTLTSARPMSRGRMRALFLEWTDALEWLQRRALGSFRADEMKRWSGLGHPAIPLHYHGLLVGAPHLSLPQADALWREIAGDADIRPYRAHEGAIRYCLKNALWACGDYEIGGTHKAFQPYRIGRNKQ